MHLAKEATRRAQWTPLTVAGGTVLQAPCDVRGREGCFSCQCRGCADFLMCQLQTLGSLWRFSEPAGARCLEMLRQRVSTPSVSAPEGRAQRTGCRQLERQPWSHLGLVTGCYLKAKGARVCRLPTSMHAPHCHWTLCSRRDSVHMTICRQLQRRFLHTLA